MAEKVRERYDKALDMLRVAEASTEMAVDLLREKSKVLPNPAGLSGRNVVLIEEIIVLSCLLQADSLQRLWNEHVHRIDRFAEELVVEHGLKAVSHYRQSVVKNLTHDLHLNDMSLVHPESGEPCSMIAIADDYGAKFALRSKATGKRSHTTRILAKLLPFRVTSDTVARYRASWKERYVVFSDWVTL